jgi:ADP-ribose pyrophosphatase
MQKWKKKSSKVIYTHPRITLLEDQVELPDGTLSSYVRFDGHKSAAMVLAVRDEQVLLQREYSYPPDEILYQLPAGAIEEGEVPETAAKREFIESSWLPLQFIPENIRNGKIVNVGLLTAWAFFSAREKSS